VKTAEKPEMPSIVLYMFSQVDWGWWLVQLISVHPKVVFLLYRRFIALTINQYDY